MKKVLMWLAVIFVVLVLVGGGVLYYFFQRYGLTESPSVSHNSVSVKNTRLRIVVKPEAFSSLLENMIPADRVPKIPGVDVPRLLGWFLPREIAVVAGSDYSRGMVDVILFINERRGGPLLAEGLNRQGILQRSTAVTWEPAGFILEERGKLTVRGRMKIPEGLGDRVTQDWPQALTSPPANITDNHAVEAVLENRDGEGMLVAGLLADLFGIPWQQAFSDLFMQQFLTILTNVRVVRAYGDPTGPDQASVVVRIEADPKASSLLEFPTNGFILPQIKQFLAQNYNVTVEGEARWSAPDEALIGNFTVKGWETAVRRFIGPK
jgi:hypothetical protein